MKVVELTPAKLESAAQDNKKSAELAQLVYVSDTEPGIRRKRLGKSFVYLNETSKVNDHRELERIKKLVIPPAWEEVWICKLPNGHLQATGYDMRVRKQYRYHPMWNSVRSQTKFHHMYEFGKALPKIRKQVGKDLAQPELNEKKVLALLLKLMDETGIRIGNESYEKQNGSFGLTTLKDHHVSIQNNHTIQFLFKGKKGVMNKISLRNKRLARMVKQCRDIPGKELFQYYDEKGRHHSIDSGKVNDYIHELTGENFTAKDFRTWNGTVLALSKLKSFEVPISPAAAKKCLVETLDHVAEQLSNTRTVCKKYYVHPAIFEKFEQAQLHSYFRKRHGDFDTFLSNDETVLLKILEDAAGEKVKLQ
ncbi:MAG TPA: DNA topoisomerase IB [Chitinophagales bacterium]|nr:DNA topoisomerase IB [Chitinophagales bacterium]